MRQTQDTMHFLRQEGEDLFRRDNFYQAIECYKRMLQLAEEMYREDDPIVSMSLSHLGDCWVELKNFSEALPVYERSLSILRRYPGQEPRKNSLVRALLVNIGNVLLALCRPQEALVHFQEALRMIPPGAPEASEVRHAIYTIKALVAGTLFRRAIGLSKSGEAFFAAGRLKEALTDFQGALAIFQKFYPFGRTEVQKIQGRCLQIHMLVTITLLKGIVL
jgi:tetratricopeptide (TPR) repeat protein